MARWQRRTFRFVFFSRLVVLTFWQPFPMNPSFKPPPPISDRQKTAMWKQWAAAPSKGTMRMMSMRYNLSQKRVAAILRLKSMEAAWQKASHHFLGHWPARAM